MEPRASSAPLFLAYAKPCLLSTMNRIFGNCLQSSFVPSVEPPSTIITSSLDFG